MLATALHVYLNAVNTGRSDVEQAQLARAILATISDDLRAAVRHVEQDVSSISSVAESAFDVGSLDEETTDGGTGGASGTGASGGSSDTGTGGSTDLAATAVPPTVVGLYGNMNQLQVDVSRIPRFDELDALMQVDTAPAGYASDLRTIAYFVQMGQYVDESSAAATELEAAETVRGGLMRRELDRATALYAAEMSGGQLLAQDGRMLAPEVTWMELQYYDGLELWSEWDSTERGGLPMAVDVRIWLRPPPGSEEAEAAASIPSTPGTGPGLYDEMYRIVVHLPAAEPTSLDTTTTGTGTDSGSTSGTSSGTSGTGSSGGTGIGGS